MKGVRILIVEDEAIVARDLRQELTELGYVPVGDTARGEDAIVLAAALEAELVLMDIQLAGAMDGIEAAQLIREKLRLPVVFLTAFAGTEVLERAKVVEPFGYIVKPFDARELRTVIEIALYKHGTEQRLLVAQAQQTAIIQAAMDGFLLTDGTETIHDVNEAYCRMSGYTRAELIGRKISEIDAADPAETSAEIVRLRASGTTRFERRHRRKDGRIIDVEVSVGTLQEPAGWRFSFVRDITEQKRAEEALRTSERRFRTVLDSVSTVAVQGYAADGTTQYWNRASELLYGYSAAEAVGRNLFDLVIPPDLRAPMEAAVRAMVTTGRAAAPCEWTLRDRNGSPVEVFSSHAVVQLPGRAVEFFCFDVDLTDRKRAERVTRESQQMFARVFHSSPAMMALSDAETGVVLEVNECFLATAGYRREEVVGQRSTEVGWVTPEDRARLAEQMRRDRRISEAELALRRSDGGMLETLYSGELIEMDGRMHLLSMWQDVTERKRVETLLRLQSGALEAAANTIVVTDRTGTIVWANAAAVKATGYALDELVGHNSRELVRSGEHDEAFYRRMWETITTGRMWSGEIVNRRKDGTRCTEEMTITSMRDERGEITHFIAVKQDITQRKRLEEQFRQAQKMEAIGQLAGGVAHDFNNILAALLMYLGLMQNEPSTDPNIRQMLKELESGVQRGATLTRQLLTFSRQQAMDPRRLNVNEIIAGLMKMLHRLLGEHITIGIEAAPDLPLVEADAGMLEQVITNLCVNSRDAMPRGGRLTLRTAAVELTEPRGLGRAGRFVRLDVTDTGCGMDEKTLQRLFEPFFTTKPVGHGTGLGLATVYGIARQHRGWVEVDSAVGHGTTFHVFLPVCESPAAPAVERTAKTLARGRGESILVAEDEVNVRTVVNLALERAGYAVIATSNGPEALERWRQHGGRFDLLLTDMVMPGGLNGREVAERLRAEKPGLRVIFCTGYSQALAADPAVADPRTAILRKPFDMPRLLSLIREVLDAP